MSGGQEVPRLLDVHHITMVSMYAQPAVVQPRRRNRPAAPWLRILAAIVLAAIGASSAAADLRYHSVSIDGVSIAYREVGRSDQPTVLLLHGVPSSSRMYDGLMRLLGNDYHLVALDYPGFGNSDALPPERFTYTFDHLAEIVGKFVDTLGIDKFVLFMQDYGAPIGMRLALARPAAVRAMVFQNGNVYEAGLGPVWSERRAYWADRAAHEDEVRRGLQSLEVTRQRHLGDDPDLGAYNPDLWQDELAFLRRPGQAAIQAELVYDYRTNLAAYPAWQAWLKQHQLPTLVLWGRYDLTFPPAGAWAFRADLPNANIVILDAGHFAMDTRLDDVATLTRQFLLSLSQRP